MDYNDYARGLLAQPMGPMPTFGDPNSPVPVNLPPVANPDEPIASYLEEPSTTPPPAQPGEDSDFTTYADQLPQSPLPTGLSKVSEGQRVSQSTSNTGIDLNTLGVLTGDKTIDKRVAKRMGGVVAGNQQVSDKFEDATQAQKDAARQQTDIEAEMADVQHQGMLDEADLRKQQMAIEVEERAKAKTREDKAMADKMNALAEYEASNVNPGALWQSMGPGAKFGELVSIFSAGLLGSRGIDTTVMKTLNEAIDRNIQAQEINIAKKGKVADRYAQIYQDVRANSMSEAEARATMRGYLYSDFKQALGAKLSAYDNPLAKTRYAAAAAMLDTEQAKNYERIYNNVQQQSNVITGQEIQRRGDEQQAAIASRRLANEEAQTRALQAAAVDKAKKDAVEALNADVLVDTSPSINPDGQNMWKFKPGLRPEMKEKLQIKVNDIAAMNGLIEEYRELARRNGAGYEGPGADIRRSADRMRAEQLRTMITTELKREASGLAATDSEQAIYNRMLVPDSWLTPNRVEELASSLQQINKAKVQTAIGGFTSPLTPEERAQVRKPTPVPVDMLGENANNPVDSFDAAHGESALDGIDTKPTVETETARLRAKMNDNEADTPLKRESISDPILKDWSNFGDLYQDDPAVNKGAYGNPPTRRFAIAQTLFGRAKGGDEEAVKALEDMSDQTDATDEHKVLSDAYVQAGLMPATKTEAARIAGYYLLRLQAEGVGLESNPNREELKKVAQDALDPILRSQEQGYYIKKPLLGDYVSPNRNARWAAQNGTVNDAASQIQ